MALLGMIINLSPYIIIIFILLQILKELKEIKQKK